MRNFLFLLLVMGLTAYKATCYTKTDSPPDTPYNGRVTRADLVQLQWWDSLYRQSTPDAAALAELKRKAKGISMVIVAGSWCSDTRRELPAFFRIADETGIKESDIEMFMVDRDKKSRTFNPGAMQVYNIPTFIFYRDGHELGRIIETSIGGMAKAMLEVLEKK